MENFAEYFKPERRIFLENISYETVRAGKPSDVRRLGCRDTVVSQLIMPTGVKIVFNRRLHFEPEAMFVLSVSFGVFLAFNPERVGEVEWKDVNIVKEFTRSFPGVLQELTARTALLVGEITAAAGGTPLIAMAPIERDREAEQGENT